MATQNLAVRTSSVVGRYGVGKAVANGPALAERDSECGEVLGDVTKIRSPGPNRNTSALRRRAGSVKFCRVFQKSRHGTGTVRASCHSTRSARGTFERDFTECLKSSSRHRLQLTRDRSLRYTDRASSRFTARQ